MKLIEFVDKFTDIGILDRIDIVYCSSFYTRFELSSKNWRRELHEMIKIYGNDEIVQFILTNKETELHLCIELKEGEKDDPPKHA